MLLIQIIAIQIYLKDDDDNNLRSVSLNLQDLATIL